MKPTLTGAVGALLCLAATSVAEIHTQIGDVKDSRTTGKFFAGLEIELKLIGDDLEGVKGIRTKIDKATDDTGRNLVDDQKTDRSFSSGSFGSNDTVTLRLKNPARKAASVKEISGVIELHKPAADPQSIVTTGPLNSIGGKPLDAPSLKTAGVSVVVLNKQQFEAQKADEKKKKAASGGKNAAKGKELEAALKDPSKVTPEMGAALGEAIGEAFSGMFSGFMSMNDGDLAFLVQDPGSKIVSIEVLGADGKPLKNRSSSSSGEPKKQTKIVSYGEPVTPDSKVQITLQTEKSVVRIPLNLTSVPLP